MPVLPKNALFLIVAAVVLSGAALAIIQSRFDAASVEQSLVRLAQENGQLTLRLDGGVRLAVLPRPALVLARGTLSGSGGVTPFATFDEARLNLPWRFLTGGPLRVTGAELRGLSADVAASGSFDVRSESGPVQFGITEVHLEQAALRFGAGDGKVLKLERAVARIEGDALDMEGTGSGLGLSDLAVRMQSAPQGSARDLALAINGMHGTERFNLRLTVGKWQRQFDSYMLQDLNLVAQFANGDDGYDVALRVPALAGGAQAAQAEKATLAATQSWKHGRLTLTYGGAARINLADGWLEWPAAKLEVNLLEGGRSELSNVWNGATRFDATKTRFR